MNPLLKAADRIERELICCDVFERLHDKPPMEWTNAEQDEYRRHQICYWGSAARSLVLKQMDIETKATSRSRSPHPNTMIGRGSSE